MNKEYLKKSKDELQEYLQFQRKGSIIQNKKGKGSYKRKVSVKELDENL